MDSPSNNSCTHFCSHSPLYIRGVCDSAVCASLSGSLCKVCANGELYARQAKDTELVEWATEIKVRAERRAGQMLAAMELKPGPKAISPTMLPIATRLSDIGITKNDSSRWQKLAAVSDEKFERAVAAAKEVAGEVTTAAMQSRAASKAAGKGVVAPAGNNRAGEAVL